MDLALRPHDLGASQYYVLDALVRDGPTMQRDMQERLQVERATLSGIVAVLLRKGLVKKTAVDADRRQNRLALTSAGAALWQELPDLTRIRQTAFAGIDPAALETAIDVLRTATERLESHNMQETVR
jgi:DNA-binding MarR family transcriptional regulator